MLTKDDLLLQNTLPNISDVSLSVYTEFSEEVLMKRKLHYFFTDETDMIVEFREWGIYHMLSIMLVTSPALLASYQKNHTCRSEKSGRFSCLSNVFLIFVTDIHVGRRITVN